jgi:hypothetical protein
VIFERDDVVDLEELVVGARSDRARRIAGLEGPTPVISQRSPDFVCPRASAALPTVTRTSTGLQGLSLASATSASAA